MGSLNKDLPLKCIDLFAGVGGIRLGFEQACKDLGYNSECVFTSEIDDWACQTYRKNFPNDGHDPKSDVTKVDETQLPDFDVLLDSHVKHLVSQVKGEALKIQGVLCSLM